MRRGTLAALAISSSLVTPALAEVMSVADLARAFTASRAMEAAADNTALSATVAYRAGRFDGYLSGLAERLNTEGAICLPSCFCAVREKIDASLAARLGEPLADPNAPANALVERLLRHSFPCRQP